MRLAFTLGHGAAMVSAEVGLCSSRAGCQRKADVTLSGVPKSETGVPEGETGRERRRLGKKVSTVGWPRACPEIEPGAASGPTRALARISIQRHRRLPRSPELAGRGEYSQSADRESANSVSEFIFLGSSPLDLGIPSVEIEDSPGSNPLESRSLARGLTEAGFCEPSSDLSRED